MSRITRTIQHQFNLKYGCNPHQSTAAIYALENTDLPFEVLNGKPGYINLLDAMNAWQLVQELDNSLKLPAAASFKHVSPAGAAVAVPLSERMKEVYSCSKAISGLATAYLRARGADPMSSFGDFIALSRTVDVSTAKLISPLVSDGIIAPGYEPEALRILSAKKKGNYVVLGANPSYTAPQEEFREVFGVGFVQQRNDIILNESNLFTPCVTQNTTWTPEAKRDALIAAIVLKYTQSNSVGYAFDGQMIGIGAGQQSRIDCTKLAGRKADIWYLRQHPKVSGLAFTKKAKRVSRTNAIISYVEGEMTPPEYEQWLSLFESTPEPLSLEEKKSWLSTMKGVSLVSDAFLPFRDNIDQASRHGVQFITQAGGSMRDQDVIEAANKYGMVMSFSGIRLFHH